MYAINHELKSPFLLQKDRMMSLEERVRRLEQRIDTLERLLRGSGPIPGAASPPSPSSVVMPTTTTTKLPFTYAIKQNNALKEHLTMTNAFIDTYLPPRWQKISTPEKASLILVLGFAPGGRLDIPQLGPEYKGAVVIGISFAAGFTPVEFSKDVLGNYSQQVNFLLDDTFLALRSHQDNRVDKLRLLLNRPDLITPIGCAYCGTTSPQSACANLKNCATWYCDQNCADAHWVVHSKTCL